MPLRRAAARAAVSQPGFHSSIGTPLAGALHGLLLLPVLLSLIGPDPVDVGAHAAVNGASKTKALEMAAVPNGKAAPGSGDYAA